MKEVAGIAETWNGATAEEEQRPLRLHVTGKSPGCLRAIENSEGVPGEHVTNRYRIELVNLLANPLLGRGDQLLAVPTPVKKRPTPMRQIVGGLPGTEKLLVGPDIKLAADSSEEAVGEGEASPLPLHDLPILRQVTLVRHRKPEHVRPLGQDRVVGRVARLCISRVFRKTLSGDCQLTDEHDNGPVGVSLQEFEERAAPREAEIYEFRLYIAGLSSKSVKALRNFKTLLNEHLRGRYELKVIDVYQSLELAKEEQIVGTPTVVRRRPLPIMRFVGDLSRPEVVLKHLGIPVQ